MGRFSRRSRAPYPRDPHWTTAPTAQSSCARLGCTNPIRPGERIFHYPQSNTSYCTACSPGVAARAAAELFNESVSGG